MRRSAHVVEREELQVIDNPGDHVSCTSCAKPILDQGQNREPTEGKFARI